MQPRSPTDLGGDERNIGKREEGRKKEGKQLWLPPPLCVGYDSQAARVISARLNLAISIPLFVFLNRNSPRCIISMHGL